MLQPHLNIYLIQGFTPEQSQQWVSVVAENLDQGRIASAKEVLNEVLESKNGKG